MKRLSFILAVLLTVSLLASCGGGGKTETAATTAAATTTAETEPAETRNPLLNDLGEFDFDGYEYRVLSVTYDPNGTFTLFDSEQTGEVLLDSLYTRNREIEERFNVVFKSEEASYNDNFNRIKSIVAANEDAWELIMLINRNAFSVALEGMLMPTEKLIHLNPDKPYYLKDINDVLTIAGKSFFLYTEESVYTFERACCLVFNKNIVKDNGLPDYYSLVKSGKWTVDKLYTDARTVAKDLDGDGAWTASDLYGLNGCADYMYPSFYNLTGELLIAKDSKDIPYFNAKSSTVIADAVDKFIRELKGNYIFTPSSVSDVNGANKMFNEGRSLFLATVAGRIFAFREMEDDFGVLPFPLANENQDKYYTRVCDAWLHVCPITNGDPARTSVIMEALGSGSAIHVFPAYYEKAVQYKVLRDSESQEMLDLIRETRIIDLAECPWFETVRLPVEKMMMTKDNTLASTLASIEPSVEKLIADALEAAAKLP